MNVEYVVDFGDVSSRFVELAMAEAESHGATLKERVIRCKDCRFWDEVIHACGLFDSVAGGFISYVFDEDFCCFANNDTKHTLIPVTHCRDCHYFFENATPHDDERPHFCSLHGIDMGEDTGFCSWGRKRDDE